MLWVFLALVLAGLVLAIWSAWIEPRSLVVKRERFALRGLRAPVRALVIGDIQPNNHHWPATRLAQLFARLSEEEQPDLVLWLGDYFNAHTDRFKQIVDARPWLDDWIAPQLPSMKEIAAAMSAFDPPMGAFAILGNHDWAWSGRETREALEAVGIRVLADDLVETGAGGQRLQLIGYEDLSAGRVPNFAALHAKLDPALPQVGLSHSPDAFPDAQGGPPLMLSGHTHGGQVRLPFIGAILLPVQYRRFDQGWFAEFGRHLYVTSGLGTSLPPVRLFCPPEVVVLDLVPEEKSDG